MPKVIPPERFTRYYQALRQGHSKRRAAEMAGISLPTIRKYEAEMDTCPVCGSDMDRSATEGQLVRSKWGD